MAFDAEQCISKISLGAEFHPRELYSVAGMLLDGLIATETSFCFDTLGIIHSFRSHALQAQRLASILVPVYA